MNETTHREHVLYTGMGTLDHMQTAICATYCADDCRVVPSKLRGLPRITGKVEIVIDFLESHVTVD